jgi:hypothetical protein
VSLYSASCWRYLQVTSIDPQHNEEPLYKIHDEENETRDEYEKAPHKAYEVLDEDDEENETNQEGTNEKDAMAAKSEAVGVDRSENEERS